MSTSSTIRTSSDIAPATVADVLLGRRDDRSVALRFEDRSWTWPQYIDECARRASWLRGLRQTGPLHVGVLLENVPDFAFFLGAAGLSGAVVVALNPTRRGAELARDIAHSDCQLLVTDDTFAAHLDGVDLPFGSERVFDVGSASFLDAVAAADADPATNVEASDLFMLMFTSGTSGVPKAVRCTQGKVTFPGRALTGQVGLTPDDVLYVAMPLFHSNAVFVGWGAAIASGATLVLRRRFSASGFLPDVRRYGVTYFNYVGRPLCYILATPEQPDDADNPLRLVIGNEAADDDIKRFSQRFGCIVIDGFGSTEGGVYISRTPHTPTGSLGMAGPGIGVMNPATNEPCPPALRDADGHLLNGDEAIGELVNTSGAGAFEGYYKNDEANAERMRNNWYWSGDLAYTDALGFVYFVGRTLDWLRVDGENFGAVPVERVLERHPDVVLAPVYAVPAPDAGDEVMTALLLREGVKFDPDDFVRFLGEQLDLGTKWVPRFVRISWSLPMTESNKVLKRVLARERWNCEDSVWWRPSRALDYRLLTADDRADIAARFREHGRESALQT